MMFEAVWFKDGKEIYWVDPVLDTRTTGEGSLNTEVYNGYSWYSSADCFEEPDDFIIRVKKDA